MTEQLLQETTEDDIRIVTLNHGKTNSLNRDMLRRLGEIVAEADENPSPKGIVLTGEGRFFSSGFDLPMFLGFSELREAVEFFEFEEQVLTSLFACRKPVVAALNGHTAAGGLILAMAADYRIIKEHPKIKVGMSENKIGLPLSVAQHEVMRFGFDSNHRFRDVMFFSDMVDVFGAREKGLVDELAAEDMLMERARQVVSLWIDNPGRPFMRMKQMLRADTVQRIRRKLAEENWQAELKNFFRDEVRQTLEFVQASMK
ncbi:enoyl-CoA hydratase/carnithine racemase [Desulfosalsimonas propionicica]|uniref:Enoyl-CoA hydratase/carnithine racemase n=1 Tax=Desulfosalsimonas propionicica TaxID=332175 RepID=A0A7W0C6D0_9BACT|nr:enoyl-CoA hydratase/isomerase family protein [Desulfosalsimonas propionicica]MBA2879952.1 enoyl-CoA hydratase/carnithine racemase [Desulfosalsimonas propionicica]